MDCLSEYAYFVKIVHLFCGMEGYSEYMNILHCLTKELFLWHSLVNQRGRVVCKWEVAHPAVAF